MLNHLVIKNFAIIQDIEVDFYSGMNMIIGETGAGKSIIIDALGLLMGNRSTFDKIRNGENKAFIEGEFYVSNKNIITQINNEYDGIIDDENVIIVSRSLDISGKSSCKINSHSVTINCLKNIMERVIDIHSQHKDNSFFDESQQINYLDKYIISLSTKDELTYRGMNVFDLYDDEYKKLIFEKKKLKELQNQYDDLGDIELLQFQYNEIEKANIKENELEELDDEIQVLNQFSKMANNYNDFNEAYNNCIDELYQAKKSLNNLKDEKMQNDIERFNSAYYELDDAVDTIRNIFQQYSDKLEKMDYLIQRRSLLKSLSRKYGSSTKEILSSFEKIRNNIDLYNNFEEMIEDQKNIILSYEKELEEISSFISKLRIKYIPLLENKVNKELKDLLLENAIFKIDDEIKNLNENGIDNIRFLLCANVGGKYMSLSQTASLGETSRINLALKTVFNEMEKVETIIFDEIDTGISGRVGTAVSKKLFGISKYSQTIVISHLPQVAANGEHTYFVNKVVDNNSTKTVINEISNDEKIIEIAKMLSANEVTVESLTTAKKLIENINK